MSWRRIQRGKPNVLGIDPDAPSLLHVEIPLTESPPEGWEIGFEHPEGVSISIGMHPPRLIGNVIVIRPPDKELDAYVTHVDARIEAANKRYERDVLPKIEKQNATEKAQQDRIDEANRRAREL